MTKKLSVEEALRQGKIGYDEVYKTRDKNKGFVLKKIVNNKENIPFSYIGYTETAEGDQLASEWTACGETWVEHDCPDDLVEYIGKELELSLKDKEKKFKEEFIKDLTKLCTKYEVDIVPTVIWDEYGIKPRISVQISETGTELFKFKGIIESNFEIERVWKKVEEANDD